MLPQTAAPVVPEGPVSAGGEILGLATQAAMKWLYAVSRVTPWTLIEPQVPGPAEAVSLTEPEPVDEQSETVFTVSALWGFTSD